MSPPRFEQAGPMPRLARLTLPFAHRDRKSDVGRSLRSPAFGFPGPSADGDAPAPRHAECQEPGDGVRSLRAVMAAGLARTGTDSLEFWRATASKGGGRGDADRERLGAAGDRRRRA